VAADLSPKSAKEAAFACSKRSTPCIKVGYTIEQLSHATGSRAGVIAVTDGGIAAKLTSLLNQA
jgi:ribosomal protein L7Ae-like RNA K-turn-binding protein